MVSQAQDPPQSMGSTNVVFRTETRFDPSYLKTPPGIMKATVVVLNLLGFICIQSSAFWYNGRGVYFNIVAHLGLWFSGILLLLYVFHFVEKYHNFMWLKVEMIVSGVLTFLYLIASTIAVAFGSAAYSAAGLFGYLAMVVYGFEVYLKARAIRRGEPAQGERVRAAAPPARPAPPAPCPSA